MSLLARCPACRAPLDLPEHLKGKDVACPRCGERFIGAAARPDLAEALSSWDGTGSTALQHHHNVSGLPNEMEPITDKAYSERQHVHQPVRLTSSWLLVVGVIVVAAVFGGITALLSIPDPTARNDAHQRTGDSGSGIEPQHEISDSAK